MVRPRKLPDADILHQLRTTGRDPVDRKRPAGAPFDGPWSYEQIAESYGVTKAAVHLALKKSNLVTPRPRYEEDIPWQVAVEHSSDYRLGMLRLAARERRGLPIPSHKARYLHNWIDNMSKPRPGAPLGVVVDYDRDFYPEGFAYVPREDGEEGLIRQPVDEDVHAH